MKVTHAFPALALAVVFASAGYAQQPQTEPNQDTPLFRMEVFGDAMSDLVRACRATSSFATSWRERAPGAESGESGGRA